MPDFAASLRARPWLFAGLLSVVLLIANVAVSPAFANPDNLPEKLTALSPLLIVALASTPAIISGGGGIDLSIGPLAVLCNVLFATQLLPNGIDAIWVGLPLLLALGLCVGGINGVLVAVLRYQPVVATLCSFFVISGVILLVGATPRPTPHNWTTDLGGSVGPVPGALILIAVPVAVWAALGRTAFHRNLYAVGGNDVAAFSAGVKVVATRISAYALGGLFAAVAGVALTALLQASEPSAAAQYTLIALAAVALGGTPLFGGRGGLLGSALGALTLYLMQTLVSAASVPSSWLSVVYGTMLLVGVVIGGRAAAGRNSGGKTVPA